MSGAYGGGSGQRAGSRARAPTGNFLTRQARRSERANLAEPPRERVARASSPSVRLTLAVSVGVDHVRPRYPVPRLFTRCDRPPCSS
jgi:hypothetical protein